MLLLIPALRSHEKKEYLEYLSEYYLKLLVWSL